LIQPTAQGDRIDGARYPTHSVPLDPVPSTIIGILPVGGQPGIEIVEFESGHEIGD
jgi:hypothetical protein